MDKDLSLKIRCHLGSAIAYYQDVLDGVQKLPDDDYNYAGGIGKLQTKRALIQYWADEIASAQDIINQLD